MQTTQKMLVKKSSKNLLLTLVALLYLTPLASCGWDLNSGDWDLQIYSDDGTASGSAADVLAGLNYRGEVVIVDGEDGEERQYHIKAEGLEHKNMWFFKTDGEGNQWMFSKRFSSEYPHFLIKMDKQKPGTNASLNRLMPLSTMVENLNGAEVQPSGNDGLFMSAFQMDPELVANFPAYVNFLSENVNEFLTEDVFDLTKVNDSYLTDTIPAFIKQKITLKIFSTYNHYFKKTRNNALSPTEDNMAYLNTLFDEKVPEMGDSKKELSINEYLQPFLAIWMNRIKEKLSKIVNYKNFFLLLETYDEYFKKKTPPKSISNDELAQFIFRGVYEPPYEEARIKMADDIDDHGENGDFVYEDFAKKVFNDDNMLKFYDSPDDTANIDSKPKTKEKIGNEIRKVIVEILKLPFEEYLPSDMGQSTLNTFKEYVKSVLTKWTLDKTKWNEKEIDMAFFKQLYQVKNGTFDKISKPDIEQVELKETNVLTYSSRRLLVV
jgi:hypothetical protein